MGNRPDLFTQEVAEMVLDISYADDTFLASRDANKLGSLLRCLIRTAGSYGLEPNWDKTVHLRIGHEEHIVNTEGNRVKTVAQAEYLGSLLTVSGSVSSAVNRRIGEAKASFSSLCIVWKHANIAYKRKLEIYRACILSKLLFSLECECLKQVDKAKLNAFRCRCLRTILKIPHSMISHVTNCAVLEAAASKPLSETLLFQQLMLFGKIAMQPDTDFTSRLVFEPGCITPARVFKKKRGRPRLAWQSVIYAHALAIAPQNHAQVQDILLNHSSSMQQWKHFLKSHL